MLRFTSSSGTDQQKAGQQMMLLVLFEPLRLIAQLFSKNPHPYFTLPFPPL